MLEYLVMGLGLATDWQNIVMAILGAAAGIAFGALPGFTAAMGVAVLLPLTYGMSAQQGLILLGAVFCGAMYGGSISAILLHTPGTPAAAATAIDGYEMTKKGRAGEALQEAVTASFLGGIFSVTALLFIAPPLAKVALKFGPPEYFLLAIFGLTIIVTLTAKSLIKGIMSGILGLLFGTFGMDPLLAFPRFTFGQSHLMEGIALVPALIGLFSISEVLALIKAHDNKFVLSTTKIKVGFPTVRHVASLAGTYLRSAVIGTFVGMLPGAGGSIASFLSYNEAKRFSKHPEKFGTGYVEGVAACESANNAMAGGALIPMLTLGIPGDSVAAILMGGLMIHGLQPGAELFSRHANIAYTFIIGLYLANVAMLLLGVYAAPYFVHVTKTPVNVLAAVIVVLAVIGSYAINNSMFDVWVMLFFGFLGYFMRTYGFDVAPVVLGIILGPIAEKGLTQTITISGGQNLFVYLISRPICLVLLLMTVASLLLPCTI